MESGDHGLEHQAHACAARGVRDGQSAPESRQHRATRGGMRLPGTPPATANDRPARHGQKIASRQVVGLVQAQARRTPRVTVQKSLLAQLQLKLNPLSLNSFGSAQLDLFDKALEIVRPCAVIVANSAAAQIYIQRRNPKFDANFCCYVDAVGTAEQRTEFPMFPSGMWSGGALDIYSIERIFCQVAKHFGRSQQFGKWRSAPMTLELEENSINDL